MRRDELCPAFDGSRISCMHLGHRGGRQCPHRIHPRPTIPRRCRSFSWTPTASSSSGPASARILSCALATDREWIAEMERKRLGVLSLNGRKLTVLWCKVEEGATLPPSGGNRRAPADRQVAGQYPSAQARTRACGHLQLLGLHRAERHPRRPEGGGRLRPDPGSAAGRTGEPRRHAERAA